MGDQDRLARTRVVHNLTGVASNQLAETEWPPPTASVAQQPGLFVNDPANSWRTRHFSPAVRGEIGATASPGRWSVPSPIECETPLESGGEETGP